MYKMIAKVLKKYEVYMHQLTPHVIARLSICIWAMQRKGVHTVAEAFYKVHEVHY
jgi:hypothetical protein